MSDSQQYCTTKTAALRLGVTPQRVRELAAVGKLAGRRNRNVWEFDLAEIERRGALPRRRRWQGGAQNIANPDALHPTSEAVYFYIIQFKKRYGGESPTTREIAASLGLSSTSVVQHHLKKLEAAGRIKRAGGESANDLDSGGAVGNGG